MFAELLPLITQEISGLRAYDNVKEITAFHRIQVTPDFRRAAQRVAEILSAAPLEVSVLTYPADGKTAYWGYVLPEEWVPEEAELWIVEPAKEKRRLASFTELPISLIQRSAPTPPQGITAELVVVDRAEEEEAYRQVDVAGKLVLAQGDVERLWRLAVKKHGAVGLIVDNMNEFAPVRERMDLPDAVQYTSFWWYGQEERTFGFVLSPRAGEQLRRLAKETQSKGGRLKLWARVKAQFRPGQMENVMAFLPGQTEEEILVIGHLCHPKPGANDNASGAGTVMEVARALAQLVAEGRLPRPRRGLRFLLVPEMSGTYAYLSTNEGRLSNILAGINLDMVGEKQEVCGSSLLVEKPALALPTFAGDLAALILQEISKEAANFSHTYSYALFRHSVTPFSGGSDHYVLSDPTVGIPTPMIIQWPDRFYHTSQDTIDKVDPEMLRRVGVLTATYAYSLAQAGYREALYLAQEMVVGFAAELHQFLRPEREEIVGGGASVSASMSGPNPGAGWPSEETWTRLNRRLEFFLERKMAALESLNRLASPAEKTLFQRDLSELSEELRRVAQGEKERLARLREGLERAGAKAQSPEERATEEPGRRDEANTRSGPGEGSSTGIWPKLVPGEAGGDSPESAAAEGAGPAGAEGARPEGAALIPRRLYRGPVNLRPYLNRLPEGELELWQKFEKEKPARRRLGVYAVYWADGKRTLADIVEKVELETGLRDPEYIERYFRLLARLGLVELGA